MIRRWGFGLVVVTGLVVLVAGWLPSGEQGSGPTADSVPHVASAQAAAAERSRQVEAWIASSLARPLFSRHRRPPAEAVLAAAAASPEPVPRLTGVLFGPFGGIALFARGGSDRSVALQEGGAIGPYRIRRISPGEVLIDGPGGERLLTPGFGGSGGRPSAGDRVGLAAAPTLASRP